MKETQLTNIDTIAVGIDFSDFSFGALQLAKSFAIKLNASLVLFHIQESEIIRREKLESLAAELKKEGTQAEAIYITTDESSIYDWIEKIIKDYKIDLIAIGSHGKPENFSEWILGSNAQKSIVRLPIPVLLASTQKPPVIQKTVFCSDFKEDQTKQYSTQFTTVSRAFESEHALLYINTPTWFEDTATTLKRVEKYMMSTGSEHHLPIEIYNDFFVEHGIEAYCKRNNIDLVGICTHGYTGIKKWFNPNIVQYLAGHLSCSMLSFPMKM